ncbi:hypothetical protein [Nonomuraea jabiensis]|uniref:hypothetical protein n=1 Tax=Nonomuraea jabiensis TaxID=882448 RepID=UPI003D703551
MIDAAWPSPDRAIIKTGLVERIRLFIGGRSVQRDAEIPRGHDFSSLLAHSACWSIHWNMDLAWVPGLRGVHQTLNRSPPQVHSTHPQRCPLWLSTTVNDSILRAALKAALISLC